MVHQLWFPKEKFLNNGRTGKRISYLAIAALRSLLETRSPFGKKWKTPLR
jgi:hypothetical protein